MLDEKDRRLIVALKQDARRSVVDLARYINLSRTATHDRLSRLEERGIIKGYTVLIDESSLSSHRAFYSVLLGQGRSAQGLTDHILRLPNILCVYQIAGQFDLLVLAEAATCEDLADMRDTLSTMRGVVSVKTHTVLKGGHRT